MIKGLTASLCAVWLLGSAGIVKAQTAGTIAGTVTDESGSVIPGRAFGDPDYPETGINVVPPLDTSTGADALGGMAGNRLFEWQNREVIKVDGEIHSEGSHHHAWEVVYFCPKGEMITYVTPPGKNQPRRTVKWSAGDMTIAEADEIHQHSLPVKGTRFLQFKVSGYFRGVGIQPMGRQIE